ncbi:MAG: Asp-tRNA(Asn)/Glu-tRNA(Gln) amidotransferase subunit GatC [Anaerofustis stercorihominis]|nr:Asp-tRNA(Asn)/Glu-tRNA(Gln) amidotransferase subunit GatC [Anaerofustis stercorihominis]
MKKEDILYTAKLSYLNYEEKDLEKVEKGLGDILSYVEMLSEVDTTDVKPLTHVMETVNVLREDEVGETLSIEEVSQNAPDWDDRTFKVPKVM